MVMQPSRGSTPGSERQKFRVMADYRVHLDLFSGPLDLLLYLVRRNEVDIVQLPISKITHQFLQFLEVLEFLDLDLVGDFVVMASTLVEIKSRQVLPRTVEEDSPEEVPVSDDPSNELIQQLMEYKRYKDAAIAMEQRAAEWQERYPRLSDDRPSEGKDHSEDPIKEVELWDLVSALSRVIHKKVVEESSSIRYDDTPISVYIDRIGARVREVGRVPFSEFFEGTNLRSKIIGIFLAVLELLRHHGFRADQIADYNEIYVLPPATTADAKGTSQSLLSVESMQSVEGLAAPAAD
jgi:segregation and condensation protein A